MPGISGINRIIFEVAVVTNPCTLVSCVGALIGTAALAGKRPDDKFFELPQCGFKPGVLVALELNEFLVTPPLPG